VSAICLSKIYSPTGVIRRLILCNDISVGRLLLRSPIQTLVSIEKSNSRRLNSEGESGGRGG
jgi:hypothetical protein